MATSAILQFLLYIGNMLYPLWDKASIALERDGYSDAIVMTTIHTLEAKFPDNELWVKR